MPRAHLDKDPHEVARCSTGWPHYDVTNSVTLLRAGPATGARRPATALDAAPGDNVLDIAAGTGCPRWTGQSGARCVAADFSLGMLRRGAGRRVPKVAADALRLPFADGAFDAVTCRSACATCTTPSRRCRVRRVVRPGGRLVVCEFSSPVVAPFRLRVPDYLMRALPAMAAGVVQSGGLPLPGRVDPGRGPTSGLSLRSSAEAGWADVEWTDLTGGIVALHRAVRPVCLDSGHPELVTNQGAI